MTTAAIVRIPLRLEGQADRDDEVPEGLSVEEQRILMAHHGPEMTEHVLNAVAELRLALMEHGIALTGTLQIGDRKVALG